MVAAERRALIGIQKPEQVPTNLQEVTTMLRKQFTGVLPQMHADDEDVLTFLHFSNKHWRKIRSTTPF